MRNLLERIINKFQAVRQGGFFYLPPPLLTIHLLIVVIAIMAILAAVLVPTVTNKIKDANESSAKSSASALAESIRADIITASTTSDNMFQGEYFAVRVTPAAGEVAAKVEIGTITAANGANPRSFTAETEEKPLDSNTKIKVKNNNNKIEVSYDGYTWKYTIDLTGKVTIE